MSQSPLQSDLLGLFAQTRSVLQTFVDSRNEEQRLQIGTEKQGSAKDLLANVACWMDYMVQRMAYFKRDEIPPRDVDFAAVGRQAFTRYQYQPWDRVVAYSNHSLDSLIAAVKQFTDEQLNANNVYGDGVGDPLWQEIRANGFIYPLQEFEKFYQNSDDQQQAAAVRAKLVAVIGEEKPIVTDLISAGDLAVQQQGGESPLIIDVRDAKEYAEGHIPGAVNIPLSVLETKLDQISTNTPVVTYCNMNHKGFSRGEKAAAFLAQQGYRASALDGGYPGWNAAGSPVEAANNQE